ncbi:MAG: AbiJ-NTD4 domain-containing protein [Promethearchaeota archaeon]
MKFSQRIGKKQIKTALLIERVDEDLKNRLWNTILEDFFNKIPENHNYPHNRVREICKVIWKEFFNYRVDEIPKYINADIVSHESVIRYLKDWFFKAEWFEIYDLIEFLSYIDSNVLMIKFVENCNTALKRELAGYRIVEDRIVQITSEEEIQEIEIAIETTDKWKSVNTHLSTALAYLANRKDPDYRNSIKESISAVEAVCIIITGDKNATLGKALTEIEKKHKLHGALKATFSSLYGYTSDSGGIRHALIEGDPNIEFEDAKFMLVSCSAFINYLKTKMNI